MRKSQKIILFLLLVVAACATLFMRFSGSATGASNHDLLDTTSDAGLQRHAGGHTADLLSAFHGLEALPRTANLICKGAKDKDGMPVIFSTQVDFATVQAGDFRVTTASGQIGQMHCVSVLPATDPGELRTVLLIGELGNADTDPPIKVEIVGHLHSIDGQLDYRGATVEVTPLHEGPSMIMAQAVDHRPKTDGMGLARVRGSLCPTEGITQALRVTWAGGVTLADGSDPSATDGALYTVVVEDADGSQRDVKPVALADLGDGDNNHMLCLNTADVPISVSFPAGVLTDPNNDLNPESHVDLSPAR